MGFLPFPEIQYLAFFHNAADQIRGEAASMQFFSNGQYRNPMVLRLPGLGFQKGFGGHFHNDNSIAALRDIPGLIIACPSRGDDAAMLLRTLTALAKVDGRVCVFLEPIALYMRKDLYQEGDVAWTFTYPEPDKFIVPGEARIYHKSAKDLLIISYANGVLLSLRAAKKITEQTDRQVRIMDLRWLNPLNQQQILQQAKQCCAILVVDEGRYSGALGHEIIALIAKNKILKAMDLITAEDTYTPLGDAANAILPSEEQIISRALNLFDEIFP